MTWRYFRTLLNGLSPDSWWYRLQRAKSEGPKVIKGAAVDSYFASIGKAA